VYSNKHKQRYIQRVAGSLIQANRKRTKAEYTASLKEFDEEDVDEEIELMEGDTV